MGDIASIITAVVALAALAGGYIQFVLRRTIHPCIEFDVEFSRLDRHASDQVVGDIICRIRNEGPGVGYVTNVRCYTRYRLAGESGKSRDEEPDFAHRLPGEGFFAWIQEIVLFSQGLHSGVVSHLHSLRMHA